MYNINTNISIYIYIYSVCIGAEIMTPETEKIESWCFCAFLETISFELLQRRNTAIFTLYFPEFIFISFFFLGVVKDCDGRRRSEPLIRG